MIYVFGILCISNAVLLAWALLQRKLVRDTVAKLTALGKAHRELWETKLQAAKVEADPNCPRGQMFIFNRNDFGGRL